MRAQAHKGSKNSIQRENRNSKCMISEQQQRQQQQPAKTNKHTKVPKQDYILHKTGSLISVVNKSTHSLASSFSLSVFIRS